MPHSPYPRFRVTKECRSKPGLLLLTQRIEPGIPIVSSSSVDLIVIGPLTAAWSRPILNPMVQYSQLDDGFAALADPTRRGILDRLGHEDASISDLAECFEMSLTGIKKHVQILERAGLVTTEKVGRVRLCRLGPSRLESETTWIATYQQMLEARLDRLGEFLDRTKGTDS